MSDLWLPPHVRRELHQIKKEGRENDSRHATHPHVLNVAAWKWVHDSLKPDEFQLFRVKESKQILLAGRIPETTPTEWISDAVKRALKAFRENSDATLVRFFCNKE